MQKIENKDNKKPQRIRKHYEMACSYEKMVKEVNILNNKIMKNLAYTIKQERLHKKVSLRDLYKITKVSVKTIKEFEEYKSMPKLDTILKLAYALGININNLFYRSLFSAENKIVESPQQHSMKIINEELSKLFDKKAKEDILKYMEFINTTTGNRKENQHTANYTAH